MKSKHLEFSVLQWTVISCLLLPAVYICLSVCICVYTCVYYICAYIYKSYMCTHIHMYIHKIMNMLQVRHWESIISILERDPLRGKYRKCKYHRWFNQTKPSPTTEIQFHAKYCLWSNLLFIFYSIIMLRSQILGGWWGMIPNWSRLPRGTSGPHSAHLIQHECRGTINKHKTVKHHFDLPPQPIPSQTCKSCDNYLSHRQSASFC